MFTPQRTTTRFAVVSIKGTFRWTDENGKKRQRTQRFEQTINPWNTNARGEIKGQREILEELNAQRKLWLLQQENDQRDRRTAA